MGSQHSEAIDRVTAPFRARACRFLAVCGQLALILLLIYLFKFEQQRPFFEVMCLGAGGFVIHAWLPRRFRLAFFCLLSLASIVLLLGWTDGAWVLGIGGGLIALCYLPVPLGFRVLVLGVVGALLALARLEYHKAPFWPVLGAMFMFRLIVYLYETRHERRPPLLPSLAYFFPLPNVCFTLFPVIDFKTFRQTYYDQEDYAIYQTGVGWIVRGLTHLLLYRCVKSYLLPAPHEVHDLPHLALFLAANYALYLRVSGWFHLITGLLHLFGFNLPRTHYHYFLASSCSDFWRRINIYWTDFMAKIFFLPAFFNLRGWGTRPALAVAALAVFLGTWLLHAYQVFWLLGELPLTARDALVWLTIGLLVALNLQFDLSAAARRGPPATAFSWGRATRHSLQVVGMFSLVSLFWGIWTIPALPSFLSLPTTSGVLPLAGSLGLLAAALGIAAVGVLAQRGRAELLQRKILPLNLSFRRSATLQAAALALLVFAGLPPAADFLATLRIDAPTPMEARREVQGYYEEIVEARVQASTLEKLLSRPDPSVGKTEALYVEITRPVDDLQGRELIPGWSGSIAGKQLTINQLGMRDREGISLKKPAGACRIALLGSSIVMGYGVADDEVFGRLLEARLNAERREGGPAFELLNFGAGMSYALQRRVVLERKIFSFEPDALYYFAHQDELLGPPTHLARLVYRGGGLPYPYLTEVVRKAGITPDMSYSVMEGRLHQFGPEIVLALYLDLVEQCRKRGVLPVWVYIPVPGTVEGPVKPSEMVGLAEQAGFVVADLTDWAAGYEPQEVRLPGGDFHANALGHRLLAQRLFTALRERPELLPDVARLKKPTGQ